MVIFTVRKRSCGKVMFSEACVKNSVHRGSMHGRRAMRGGHAWRVGHAWQGAYMVGGMHGRGHAWQGECAWWGACMAGGMHGGGRAWWGGVHGRRYATAADGTHPTGMHSC